MKKLRFAPLIRVSTDTQEKQGESLRTQKNQITQYVEILGGTIPDHCWRYSGQEHATADYERKKLDQLLSDSSQDIFDAVIVCDASRWSRDNRKSKDGLETLRTKGKRFFVGTTEYDLYNPEQCFFLGLAAEIGEFQANQQSLKSIVNRIERAKRGIPSVGKRPYGRTYDKKTDTWDLDKEKVKNIQWAAEQYLKGSSMAELSKTLNMNTTNLWKTLNHRSGTEWECRFRSKKLNIDETVIMTIPRLLDQSIIDAIHRKGAANKTYTHGHIKHKYLLSRMVLCGHCGYAMFGQTNHNDRRYYRHPRDRRKECDVGFWVRAEEIEEAVVVQLFRMYGDVAGLEKAMLKAIPNPEQIEKARAEVQMLEKRLSEVKRGKTLIVEKIAKEIISDTEAADTMQAFRETESHCKERLEILLPQLETAPTEAMIRNKAAMIKRALRSRFGRPKALDKMTWEDKRKLVEMAFDGKDPQGKRLGVYVKKPAAAEAGVLYTIKGVLADKVGELPMDDFERDMIFGFPNEITEADIEPVGGGGAKNKLNLFSTCI